MRRGGSSLMVTYAVMYLIYLVLSIGGLSAWYKTLPLITDPLDRSFAVDEIQEDWMSLFVGTVGFGVLFWSARWIGRHIKPTHAN